MQCSTPGIGMSFQAVEDALWDTFLPSLFQGYISHIPGKVITGMPFKQARIALPDPTRTAGANWMVSCVITGRLVAALRRTADFRLVYHALLMGEGREEIRWRHVEAEETTLVEAWAAASKPDA